MAGAGQTYTGVVKSFNPHKGWGFVECGPLGADAFVLKSELNGFAVTKGDQLKFTVTNGPKGLQAMNITVATPGHEKFFGEIKTWNAAKGYGFLTSPACTAIFGKDVFALGGEFRSGYGAQGMQVMFKAAMSDRGPVASDIQVLGFDSEMAGGKGQQWGPGYSGNQGYFQASSFAPFGGKGWQGMAMPAMGGMGWHGGKGGFGKGGWGSDTGNWASAGTGSSKPSGEAVVYYGTLRGMNVEKGWGHIACEAMTKMLGRDIFVMKTNLEAATPLAPGDSVSFNIEQGPKGPHATNIQPFDTQSAAMVFHGTVKSFNDTKGWGFIESAEAKKVFRSDFFVHKREMGGKTPNSGDQVQFSVDISQGRASAKNVTFV